MHVPASIGRYPVTGVIGTGAFSAVYRGIDERLGSEVAIKLLGDHHSLDPDIRERFIAEARLLRRVQSPHVVRLFDLDETERHQPFHVLELVPGGNLAAHRTLMTGRGARATRDDVALVAAAITEALTALHEQRIVHRDLTPSNLLLRRGSGAPTGAGLLATNEQLVLADLGLSKDLAVSSGLTSAGGTEGFAAPEQRSTGKVDERTDVFAASALVTWLVLGHPPGRADEAELDAAGWPTSLAHALAVGLVDDPGDRPSSIVDWRDGLLAALTSASELVDEQVVDEPVIDVPVIDETVVDGGADQPGLGGPRASRRRWLAGAAAAIVAGGAGFAAARVTDGDSPAGTTITELDGGRVRFEARSGDVVARIDGPSDLTVGEPINLLADVQGASTWTWASSGQFVENERILSVTPDSPGRLSVALVVSSGSGTTVVVDARFDVDDAQSG